MIFKINLFSYIISEKSDMCVCICVFVSEMYTWVCRCEHRSQKRTSVSRSVTACLTPLRQSTSLQLEQSQQSASSSNLLSLPRSAGLQARTGRPDISVTWELGTRLRSLCLQSMSPTKTSPVPPESILLINTSMSLSLLVLSSFSPF